MIFREKDTSLNSKTRKLMLLVTITTISIGLILLGVLIGGSYSRWTSKIDLEYETAQPSTRFTNILRHQIDQAFHRTSFNSFSYDLFEAYGGNKLEQNSEKKLMLETLSRMILKEGFKGSKFRGNYATLYNYYHNLDTFAKEKLALRLNIAALVHEARIKQAASTLGVFINKEDIIRKWTQAFDKAFVLKQEMNLLVKKKVLSIVNHSRMVAKRARENVNHGAIN